MTLPGNGFRPLPGFHDFGTKCPEVVKVSNAMLSIDHNIFYT